MYLDDQGKLKIAVCILTLSCFKGELNALLRSTENGEHYCYSIQDNTWNKEEVETLTMKEKMVLQLAGQGYTNKNIAEELSLNINTVKFHKKNIYQKLNSSNGIEAIITATHRGLF
ncbi:MAG: LuxR C-terminal-related transcriptional regulator [Tannerellaceae bacterium]|nr:LuxR C-terminal-related transcriptional regulator [Tannerellaceae bacterium]